MTPSDRRDRMRLCCARCGAGLVPAWSGLRCPRAAACGRGGFVETLQVAHALRGPSRATA